MRLKKKKKVKSFVSIFLAVVCTLTATSCFLIRLPSVCANRGDDVGLLAAGFILPDGASEQKHQTSPAKKDTSSSFFSINNEDPDSPTVLEQISSSEEPPAPEPSSDEKTYKIIESQFGPAGINYENFYVKKTIDVPLNIGEELSKRPDVTIKKDGSPQVLIVHTHTSEAYMDKDQGFYYESFYPRSTDYSHNVTRVGNAIAEKLKSSNIGVIHELTFHDNPSYNGSYSRSAETILKNLEEHPSIQVVLDIHRDAIGNNESGKVKPTFVANGKKAAQIMIMSGCDIDGSLDFPDWEYNLRLALRLQQAAETLYPGMTRPMCFDDVKYNMNLTHGSLLIEVGTDANTLDEAVYTGSLLGDALTKVLNELT